jgi:hypothetical protein
MSEFYPFKYLRSVPKRFYEPVSTYWEDLRFSASVLQLAPGATHPALDTTLVGRLFRHTATDTLYAAAQLPHAWREGTVLKPHIHWTKTTAAEGGVYWRLEYRWASVGAVISDAVTIGASAVSVGESDDSNRHAITALPEIAGTGRKISDMLLMKISRVHDNVADDYAASARLLEFDIHYQVSSPGSRREYIK